MKNEDFKNFVGKMQEKLGKENSAIISDDLATLISDNITMNEEITKRDNSIKEKDALNNKLVSANSSLLQQVGTPSVQAKVLNNNVTEETEEKKISWDDCFDKKRELLEINKIKKKGIEKLCYQKD